MAEDSDAGDGKHHDQNRHEEHVPTSSTTTWRLGIEATKQIGRRHGLTGSHLESFSERFLRADHGFLRSAPPMRVAPGAASSTRRARSARMA
jgi:hypothetical protein